MWSRNQIPHYLAAFGGFSRVASKRWQVVILIQLQSKQCRAALGLQPAAHTQGWLRGSPLLFHSVTPASQLHCMLLTKHLSPRGPACTSNPQHKIQLISPKPVPLSPVFRTMDKGLSLQLHGFLFWLHDCCLIYIWYTYLIVTASLLKTNCHCLQNKIQTHWAFKNVAIILVVN